MQTISSFRVCIPSQYHRWLNKLQSAWNNVWKYWKVELQFSLLSRKIVRTMKILYFWMYNNRYTLCTTDCCFTKTWALLTIIRSFLLVKKQNSTCELAQYYRLLSSCVVCVLWTLEEGRCCLFCFETSVFCMQRKSRNFCINNTHDLRREKPSKTGESSKKPLMSEGQVVWTPQPCKVGHISKINWNAKKCTFFTSTKNLFLAHFFSKSYHSKTDKVFSTKPTPNSHKYPKFLVKKSRDNLSQSILK